MRGKLTIAGERKTHAQVLIGIEAEVYVGLTDVESTQVLLSYKQELGELK